MLTSLNRLLFLVLATLQLLSPLVHAHSSGNNAYLGMHLPGLESLNLTHHDIDNLININPVTDDGIIVDIGSGLACTDQEISSASLFYLVAEANLIPARHPLSFTINFSPYTGNLSALPFSSSPQSPRAPPVFD